MPIITKDMYSMLIRNEFRYALTSLMSRIYWISAIAFPPSSRITETPV